MNINGKDNQEDIRSITAKVISSGSLFQLKTATIYEVMVPATILSMLQQKIFAQLFDSVRFLNQNQKFEEFDQKIVWIDARGINILFNQASAQQIFSGLALFISFYKQKYDCMAKSFRTLNEFKEFIPIFNALRFNEYVNLDKLKKAVMKRDPILILIDIGGSILYRTRNQLFVDRFLDENEYCNIKRYHYYYRPNFDKFLQQIISHPRVKLGFYTSMMIQNANPLIKEIFNLPSLQKNSKDVFGIFDRKYTEPFLNDPSWRPFAIQRDLAKVFNSQKCKQYNFGLHNTIMIESNEYKVKDYPLNSIIIQPYGYSQVNNPNFNNINVLTELRDFLFNILESGDDMRTLLSEHLPFSVKSFTSLIYKKPNYHSNYSIYFNVKNDSKFYENDSQNLQAIAKPWIEDSYLRLDNIKEKLERQQRFAGHQIKNEQERKQIRLIQEIEMRHQNMQENIYQYLFLRKIKIFGNFKISDLKKNGEISYDTMIFLEKLILLKVKHEFQIEKYNKINDVNCWARSVREEEKAVVIQKAKDSNDQETIEFEQGIKYRKENFLKLKNSLASAKTQIRAFIQKDQEQQKLLMIENAKKEEYELKNKIIAQAKTLMAQALVKEEQCLRNNSKHK